MIAEIHLVRHGRSAHVSPGWLDADGIRQWMVAYDAAEIALHHPPPPSLLALAADAGIVVASTLPRAIASAALLAPGREITTSALLRETPLETSAQPLPRLGGLRWPRAVWALVQGTRWLASSIRGAHPPGVDAAALARAEEAAEWLASLSSEHGRVVAVTHGIFRTLVAAALVRRGWGAPDRRPYHEWSAWRYAAPDRG